jgi:hypothetical protein
VSSPPTRSDSTLYVVTPVFNPARFNRRYQLYREFAEYVAKSTGAKLLTVEVAFADRPFEVTRPDDPWHLQLRCHDTMFIKERAVNVAVSHLSHLVPDWRYVAWVDCDLYFSRPDWAVETVQELQHWPVVQMFQQAVDLGPDEQVLKTNHSLAYCRQNNIPYSPTGGTSYYGGVYHHPGFSWGCTREAWRTTGGLLDIAIIGSGDYFMAWSLYGEAEKVLSERFTKDFRDRVLDWQSDAVELKGLVGYLKSTLFHRWHGSKKKRVYHSRNEVLWRNEFTPTIDLRPNEWMLWTIDRDKPQLKADLEAYFRARSEDGIDL